MMNILIATDDNGLIPTLTMLKSVECNVNTTVDMYVFYHSLSKRNLLRIKRQCAESKNVRLHSKKIQDGMLPKAVLNPTRWPIEAFLRYYAIELMPSNMDKILYLDIDIIVNKDLDELYEYEFKDEELVCVCEDIRIKTFKGLQELKRETYKLLGFDENERYFNSGMMLWNLRGIRKRYTTQDLVSFTIQNPQLLQWADQSILNHFFHQYAVYVDDKKFNFRPGCYRPDEEKRLLKRAVIIHYLFKPWIYGKSGIGNDVWWQYCKKCRAGIRFYVQYFHKQMVRSVRRILKCSWIVSNDL